VLKGLGYRFIDATSGGATIDYRGLGVGGVLVDQVAFGGPPYIPMDLVDGKAEPRFTPNPRPPQVSCLGPRTTLVTVGVGGNQYNLGQIVAKCAALGVSNPGSPGQDYYENDPEGRADLARKEADLRDGFERMMPVLLSRAPHARFFFVGYPTLFPTGREDGIDACDGGIDENLTIKKGDMPFIQGQFALVNSIIREFAERDERSCYVDVAESSRPHHVCRELHEKWMFGLFARYAFDAYRPEPFPAGAEMDVLSPGWNAWIQGLLGRVDFTLTTFHPNARGAANQTAQVEAALRAAGIVT
jgi:hypothetical protein